MREISPPEPFPIAALGDILGPAAIGIQDKVQAPMELCAQSALAATALTVQAFADIQLPDQNRRPISCYFFSVASTGERKSATDDIALLPVIHQEERLKAAYKIDLPRYKNAKVAWEKARDVAVKKANGDYAAITVALNAVGPEPVPPLTPLLTCSEPTFEGLFKLMAGGHASIGIFSAEGGSFIGGHGMTDEAILRTATGLSDLWGGVPLKRVRSTDGVTIVAAHRMSLHLMAQPDVAAEMLSNALLLNQGLLSRFLVTAPASNAGTRFSREPAAASNVAIKIYEDTLRKIWERPMPLAVDTNNELSPPIIRLSAEALTIWRAFSDDVETKVKPNGEFSTILGLANKLPEHAARLAAVLTLIDDIEAHDISAEKISAGIVLAQYYASEALRMFEACRIGSDIVLAHKLLNWLQGLWTEERETAGKNLISLPDIYQYGPNAIRDKATASRLVIILIDHGWLLPQEGGAKIDGKFRREVFRIIKAG